MLIPKSSTCVFRILEMFICADIINYIRYSEIKRTKVKKKSSKLHTLVLFKETYFIGLDKKKKVYIASFSDIFLRTLANQDKNIKQIGETPYALISLTVSHKLQFFFVIYV